MKNLTVPEKHQLKIAKDTLRMSDFGSMILGGMTKAEAREILKKFDVPDKTPSRACTAYDMTFGGRCMNCGGVDCHAPQPVR